MSEKKHTLVIVESPAKAKTIEKYLGNGYVVAASIGHLIDLPKSRMAIDAENDFDPEYITVRGKAKVLRQLLQMAKRSRTVLLASDNDREGEAISYHIRNAIRKKSGDLEIRRIVFNEITPNSIREAIAHPVELDESKVSAQKARRVLDRLVGYNLSPLLWQKVKNGLSAGRVQSVALRLICEREEAVESFLPEEYWTLEIDLGKGRSVFRAMLVEYDGAKAELQNRQDVDAILADLQVTELEVVATRSTDKTTRPKPPFTTSTLQQTAATRLGFTSRRTMRVAQQLYEGINVGSRRIGLITYMRTDSTRIATSAVQEVRGYLAEHFPDDLPEKPPHYAVRTNAQDAHEAIRPTYVDESPEELKSSLSLEQWKLYSIIWERFVASQMRPSKSATRTIDLSGGKALFRVSSTTVVEKGFLKALSLLASRERTKRLPNLNVGDRVPVRGIHPEQHYTSGPSRYTDASIVKTLEEKGIGRPSTYAPIISVLLDRFYVVRRHRQLYPTQLGRIISGMLSESFPEVINVGFTAEMEKQLDGVEDGSVEWVSVVRDFYGPFKVKVDLVMENLESVKGIMDEPTEYTCENCGMPMVKKLGRYGFFLACSGFPACKTTRAVPLAECPRTGCDGMIVARRRQGSRGKEFYGCTNYPKCDFVTQYKPTEQKCPRCGHFLVERQSKKEGALKSCINPECAYLHVVEDETNEQSA